MIVYCKDLILSPPQYAKPLLYFIGFVTISSISADIIRDQSIVSSLRASTEYFSILLFFLLLKLQINKNTIEDVIILFGLSTSIIYIIQFILLQKGIVFLNVQENAIELAMDARFRITCSASIFLLYFYSLNKYLIQKQKKYLIYLFVSLLPILIQAFRTQIASIILFTLLIIYIFWKRGYLKINKIVIVSIIAIFALYQVPIVQNKIEYMIEKQNSSETFENKDYIRWKCLNFYTCKYQESPSEYITGSGIPYEGTFKKYTDRILAQGYFYQDLGLVGLAFIIGPISVLVLTRIFLKPLFLFRYKSQFLYIPIYFLFMLSISLTNAEVFRTGNFLIHSLVLYLSYICYIEKKHSKKYAKKYAITTV